MFGSRKIAPERLVQRDAERDNGRMPQRSVSIRNVGVPRGTVSATALRRIARHVLSVQRVPRDVEVEVVLADAATVRELNRLYRGRDEETDVLSFSERDLEPSVEAAGFDPRGFKGFVEAPDATPSLGEVVVCLPVAAAQAAALGQPLAGAVAHLVVHGLLHLIGFDHEASAAEAASMQRWEEALLRDLGYEGQYEHGH
jgi:probable rRNA maturation factor